MTTGTCATCGAEFRTTFTMPADECDDCFNDRYDTEPPDPAGDEAIDQLLHAQREREETVCQQMADMFN